MSPATIHSIYTVFWVVLMIAVVWWAYGRRRNKKVFDEMARLPLQIEEEEQQRTEQQRNAS
jgi:cbb3-type cytochrome oxidase subunit 3